MDEQSKATLAEITAKEPAALSESEIAFLRARRSYLNEEQRSVFAEVLTEGQENEQPKTKPFKKMNRAELEAELTTREITFDPEAKNADLVALLKESEANKE